jgi:hypothetical protein
MLFDRRDMFTDNIGREAFLLQTPHARVMYAIVSRMSSTYTSSSFPVFSECFTPEVLSFDLYCELIERNK